MGAASAVDLVVSVDPALSTHDSHVIAGAVESLIEGKFDVTDITVHIEPDEIVTSRSRNFD